MNVYFNKEKEQKLIALIGEEVSADAILAWLEGSVNEMVVVKWEVVGVYDDSKMKLYKQLAQWYINWDRAFQIGDETLTFEDVVARYDLIKINDDFNNWLFTL